MTDPFDPAALVSRLDERPGLPHRLGRHVHHDPRSRRFAFRAAPAGPLQTVLWERAVPIFDQGELGSCTGNAAAGWLATATALRPGMARVVVDAATLVDVDERLAVRLYSRATQLDPYDGAYEPDDTGSDGLSVSKALVELGYVDVYQHAFDVASVLAALQLGPVLVGTAWHQQMFSPNSRGVVTIGGGVVGGHEYLLVGYDAGREEVTFANSWGTGWGYGGYGRMSVGTLAALLADDGDATIPHAVVAAPAPGPVDPAPAPPAPEPAGRLVHLDPAVAARAARAAGRRHLDLEAYVNDHFAEYFDLP